MELSAAMQWEPVHTVHDFYDQPRLGVADFGGVAHVYECEWSAEDDDWSEVFQLSPVDDIQLAVIKEAWQIWQRWRAAHDAGTLGSDDKHPTLAIDRLRHAELRECVARILKVDGARAIKATAIFRGDILGCGASEVRWSPV